MSGNVLTIADYPLIVVGSSIYRKSESSAMMTVGTVYLAHDICQRLNESLSPEMTRFSSERAGIS